MMLSRVWFWPSAETVRLVSGLAQVWMVPPSRVGMVSAVSEWETGVGEELPPETGMSPEPRMAALVFGHEVGFGGAALVPVFDDVAAVDDAYGEADGDDVVVGECGVGGVDAGVWAVAEVDIGHCAFVGGDATVIDRKVSHFSLFLEGYCH